MDREDKLIHSLQEAQDMATVKSKWDSEEMVKDASVECRIAEVMQILGEPGRKFRKVGCGDTIFERYADVYYDEVNDDVMITYGVSGHSNRVRISPLEWFRHNFVEVRQKTIWVDAQKRDSIDTYRGMAELTHTHTLSAATGTTINTVTAAWPGTLLANVAINATGAAQTVTRGSTTLGGDIPKAWGA